MSVQAMRRIPRGEPSLADAVRDLIDAMQQLATHQIALLRAESGDAGRELLAAGVRRLAGACFALIGWLALMAALVLSLGSFVPKAAVLCALGVAHLALGVGLLRARRR